MRAAAHIVALACLLATAACGTRSEPYRVAALPDAEGYLSAVPVGHTSYSNESLVDAFIDLTHFSEDGERYLHLHRFEGPVTIAMAGEASQPYAGFLENLVGLIREESGVDLSVNAQAPNILIRFVPGEEFFPETTIQCAIVFGRPGWAELLQDPARYARPTKGTSAVLSRMSVFIPDTIEPYKVRECLLEETVQALGTWNDLYGLGPTMFNDDNAHAWPTKLDFLMLRVLYDADMTAGLDLIGTRSKALEILTRINPQGIGAPPLPATRLLEFRSWRTQLRKLADADHSEETRLAFAKQLAAESVRRAPGSAFDCFGRTLLASIAIRQRETGARGFLEDAISTCGDAHGEEDIRIAKLRLRLAELDLREQRYAQVRTEAVELISIFTAYGADDDLTNAILFELLASSRLDASDVHTLRLAATEWVAYAFGDDHDLTTKLRR